MGDHGEVDTNNSNANVDCGVEGKDGSDGDKTNIVGLYNNCINKHDYMVMKIIQTAILFHS